MLKRIKILACVISLSGVRAAVRGAVRVAVQTAMLGAALAASVIWMTPAHAIELTRNLAADAQAAARATKPLLLFVTQPGCPYCERARREYLRHLAVDAAYTPRVLMRELSIEGSVTGFDGKRSSGLDAARALKVKLYPTIVLVDGAGRPVATPLIGFTVPDFYAAQIDGRIEEAKTHLAALPGNPVKASTAK